jgi:hypothetical protein
MQKKKVVPFYISDLFVQGYKNGTNSDIKTQISLLNQANATNVSQRAAILAIKSLAFFFFSIYQPLLYVLIYF